MFLENGQMVPNSVVRESLEARGIVAAVKPPKGEGFSKFIVTTYYEYGKNPCKETIVKKVQSRWADFAARAAFYALSQNKYSAGVVEIIDTANYDELCTILVRDIEGNVSAVFKRDPKRPKLTLDL